MGVLYGLFRKLRKDFPMISLSKDSCIFPQKSAQSVTKADLTPLIEGCSHDRPNIEWRAAHLKKIRSFSE